MDAPPIHYARTVDGEEIAYWCLGAGPPVLVVLRPGLCHVGLEWQVPRFRRFYQALAEGLTVVRYNMRGVGLSGGEYSNDADEIRRDVAAVLEAVGTEDPAVVAFGTMAKGTVAARYAPNASAFVALAPSKDPRPMVAVNETLAQQAPEHAAGMIARMYDPTGLEPAEPLITLLERSMRLQDRRTMLPVRRPPASGFWWLEPDRIHAPTLVVHYPDEPMYQGGPELAQAIEGARLVVRPGRGYPLFEPDPDGLATLVRDFILDSVAASPAPPAHPSLGPATRPRAGDPEVTAPAPPPDALSEREVEVLALVAAGLTSRQIGDRLSLSPRTVDHHVQSILQKTGLKNRAAAAAYATAHGLNEPA